MIKTRPGRVGRDASVEPVSGSGRGLGGEREVSAIATTASLKNAR